MLRVQNTPSHYLLHWFWSALGNFSKLKNVSINYFGILYALSKLKWWKAMHLSYCFGDKFSNLELVTQLWNISTVVMKSNTAESFIYQFWCWHHQVMLVRWRDECLFFYFSKNSYVEHVQDTTSGISEDFDGFHDDLILLSVPVCQTNALNCQPSRSHLATTTLQTTTKLHAHCSANNNLQVHLNNYYLQRFLFPFHLPTINHFI